jgi:prepilin-type N-terminal cleavage/methylation domain-containing protein
MKPKASIAGFSLIEVLAALAIASFALVALLRGTGMSQSAANRTDALLGARIIAKSLLEDELSAVGTAVETRDGESGRYQWKLVIEPAASQGTTGNALKLYQITAQVSWTPNGSFEVTALKADP